MIKGRGVPFLLLVLVLVLRPHLAGGAYPFAQGLFVIPLLVGLALLLLYPAHTENLSKRKSVALALPWSLLIWSLITLLWTPDPGQGLRECITLLGNVTVFSIAFFLMQEEREFSRGSILILGFIVAPVLGSALYQRVFGLEQIRETLQSMAASGENVEGLALIITDNRVFAGFLNPNMLAGFLAIGICLTLDLLLTAPDRKRLLFFSILTGAQGAVLILTGSIGGSMAALSMAAAVLLVRREFKIREMVLAGLVFVLIAGGLLAIRGGGFLFGPESSVVQRGAYMAAGIDMAMVHPILGWGSGSAPGALMGFVGEGVRPVADPHNFLVRSWISWGLTGLVLLLAFLFLWVREGIGQFTASRWRNVPAGHAGFVFGSAAFLGHSMLDMDFFVPETALFGWCVIGAALGLSEREDRRNVETKSPRQSFSIGLGAAALVLVLPVFVFLQGESLAFRAGKAVAEKDFEAAASLFSDARTMLPFSGRFALDEGRARFAAGDTALAVDLFGKADTLMRASPYPSWELARAAQAAGDWGNSIPPLEKALSRYGTSPRIRIDLARAYFNLGDIGRANKLFKEARRLGMFDPQASALAADFLSRMDR